MKYKCRVSIEAWVDVEADSFAGSIEKANEFVRDYDFKRLQDINWSIEHVVDENGSEVFPV